MVNNVFNTSAAMCSYTVHKSFAEQVMFVVYMAHTLVYTLTSCVPGEHILH